jgi:hypothetical protein
MQSIRADPGKSFRPSSAFDETIVLSPIAADFVGGILWGASRVPRGAQTPQGSRSSASETRSEIRHSSISVWRPGRFYWSSFQHIPTVYPSERVFQLVAVIVLLRNRIFLLIYPCMHQICYHLLITGIFMLLACILVMIHEI